jgi:hypothetical protein
MGYGSDIRIRVTAVQRAGLELLAKAAQRSLSDFCRVVLQRELDHPPSAEAETKEQPK